MIFNKLSKSDSLILKGMAILCIALHNFLHRFPMPKENEMTFDAEVFTNYLFLLINQPDSIYRATFSFFGHFGVQVFIFLSAYGLAKSSSNKNINFIRFLTRRVAKIYPAFLLAISFYVFYMLAGIIFIGDGDVVGFLHRIYKPLLLKLTLLWNFYPGQGFSLVGPWWFLSMIFQFYLIFLLILRLQARFGDITLILISLIALLIAFISDTSIYGVSIYFTVVGHLPVLCLGIYLSKFDNIKINNYWFIGSIIMFLLGNVFAGFFIFSHISAFIIIMFISNKLLPIIRSKNKLYKFFIFYGSLSMPIFLINGFLRIPLEGIAHRYDNELITIFLSFVFITFVTAVALIFDKINSYIDNLGSGRFPH